MFGDVVTPMNFEKFVRDLEVMNPLLWESMRPKERRSRRRRMGCCEGGGGGDGGEGWEGG